MKANFEKGTKICSKCRKELPLDNFHINNYRGDKLNIYCKTCSLEVQHKYIENHLEQIQEKRRVYRQSKHGKEVRKKADDKRIKEGVAAQYLREKKKKNPYIKIVINLRTRLSQIINKEYKTLHTIDLLGCTVEEFRHHLESQFESGMSWNNYGKWHIDHIIPCNYFNLTKEENQYICFNYRNLQPLWAEENCKKQDLVPENVEELVQFLKQEIYVNH